MIFTQDLKVKQTSAEIVNIRVVITKYQKNEHLANESHYSYTGYGIAQQDAEVFIKRQSNILIVTSNMSN